MTTSCALARAGHQPPVLLRHRKSPPFLSPQRPAVSELGIDLSKAEGEGAAELDRQSDLPTASSPALSLGAEDAASLPGDGTACHPSA